MTKSTSGSARKIRQLAEEKVAKMELSTCESLSPGQMQQLLHDLRVHQAELEMQSEQLRQTQQELEASRSRYFDLYDLAPVGYLTVNEQGSIMEANRAAALMLGTLQQDLRGRLLTSLILPEDQDIYYLFRKMVLKTAGMQSCELRMLRENGSPLWINIQAAPPIMGECLVILSDISERKHLAETALRENEQRLSQTLESANAGCWDWDMVTGELYWSKEFYKLFGLIPGKNDASFETWRKVVHPDDYDAAAENLGVAIKSKLLLRNKYRIVLPSGENRWIEATGRCEYDEAGTPVRMSGICADITERKQVEDVLSVLAQKTSSVTSAEPFFNSLAQYLAQSLNMDFVCIDRLEGDGMTARTVAVWCDGYFEDNISYALKDTPCGDVVGKEICCYPASVCQLFPHDEALQHLQAESYAGVTLWNRADTPIGLIAVISRIPLVNRTLVENTLKLVAVRASAELERLDADAALCESNAYLENLIDYANAPIIVWDPVFNITRFNHAFEFMTGLTEAEVLGQSLEILFPATRVEQSMALIRKTLTGERWETVEIIIKHRAAGERTVLWNSATIFSADGKTPVATIAQGQDITARKQAEQELRDKNRELESFTYTVSHDLKSPLITIQSYAGILLKDLDSGATGRAREDVQRIEGAAAKMTNLLNDLLELSRVGVMMKDPAPIDMNILVHECLAQLSGLLGHYNVDIVVQQEIPPANGDKHRISEVLQNLVENALKYAGDQNALRIDIGVRVDGNETVFFVADNGAGVDPRHHEKIFGLFNKLDVSTAGTGIGLALVKRIIEGHGGRVWVESKGTGKGSTFCFTLSA